MPFLGQQVLDYNGEVGTYKPNVNNVKELYKVGTVATNTLSFSRATEKNTFRFSYSSTLGDHVIDRTERVNRNNVAVRFSQEISDKLKVNTSLIYVNQRVDNRMYRNGSERNPANNYMYILPNMSQRITYFLIKTTTTMPLITRGLLITPTGIYTKTQIKISPIE